jgi:GNAT superfamily N-acetyltransferase
MLQMITIRQAQPSDAKALLMLAQGFATSFVVDSQLFEIALIELLSAPSSYLAVAVRNPSEIVGYVLGFSHFTFYANGKVAWVEEITVHEAFRRRGIGASLMQSVEAWATQQDAKLIALATRRAAPFYEALGYEESATYWRKLL